MKAGEDIEDMPSRAGKRAASKGRPFSERKWYDCECARDDAMGYKLDLIYEFETQPGLETRAEINRQNKKGGRQHRTNQRRLE